MITLYIGLFWVLLFGTTASAFRWGGGPERAAASLFAVASIASVAVLPSDGELFLRIETGQLLVDVALLVGLAFIALRADRWWPLGATALQLVSTLAHLSAAVNPNVWRLGYAVMEQASSYPTQILLAVGIWRHHRRGASIISNPSSQEVSRAIQRSAPDG